MFEEGPCTTLARHGRCRVREKYASREPTWFTHRCADSPSRRGLAAAAVKRKREKPERRAKLSHAVCARSGAVSNVPNYFRRARAPSRRVPQCLGVSAPAVVARACPIGVIYIGKLTSRTTTSSFLQQPQQSYAPTYAPWDIPDLKSRETRNNAAVCRGSHYSRVNYLDLFYILHFIDYIPVWGNKCAGSREDDQRSIAVKAEPRGGARDARDSIAGNKYTIKRR